MKNYILTALAEDDLRKAKMWSLSRWGKKITKEYFLDLHKGAEYIAQNHKSLPVRDDLTGDTGLFIHAIREHYVVYVPVSNGCMVIVAVIRQTRDVPAILQKESYKIHREIKAIKSTVKLKK